GSIRFDRLSIMIWPVTLQRDRLSQVYFIIDSGKFALHFSLDDIEPIEIIFPPVFIDLVSCNKSVKPSFRLRILHSKCIQIKNEIFYIDIAAVAGKAIDNSKEAGLRFAIFSIPFFK